MQVPVTAAVAMAAEPRFLLRASVRDRSTYHQPEVLAVPTLYPHRRIRSTRSRRRSPNPPIHSIRSRAGFLSAALLLGPALAANGQVALDWVRRTPTTAPSPRNEPGMARDAGRDAIVVFGGWLRPGGAATDETWELVGGSWRNPTPSVKPPPRGEPGMVYVTSRARTLLFGGRVTGPAPTTYGDTWEWDGASWIQLAPATSPPARAEHAMVYDTRRNRVVLFGGANGPTSFFNDTWEWNGTTWTLMSTPTAPSARVAAQMAYDVQRGVTVLFGGEIVNATTVNDTWEWNGAAWSQVTPATAPPPREEHAMAYDDARQRLVLYGGSFNATTPYSDTWEFDGVTWQQIATASNAGARGYGGSVAVFDPRRGRVVLFGSSNPLDSDYALYGPLQPPSVLPLGTGCGGSLGVPQLTSGLPYLGNATFTLRAAPGQPNALAATLLSPPAPPTTVNPCTLYVGGAIAVVPGQVDPSGAANTVLPIPAAPTLLGGTLHAQVLIADKTAALGVAATAALAITLGD